MSAPLRRVKAADVFVAAAILSAKDDLPVNGIQLRRVWALVAVVAIFAALVLLLVPHGHSADRGEWLAILPLLFAGLISPLSLLSPLAYFYMGRTQDAPALPASFQRPPPFAIS
jgi:hypothetical protein